jgi:hypothetical protein
MRIRTLFLTLAGVCMLSAVSAKAQSNPLEPEKKAPRIYVGPVAGYNRSLHAGGFSSRFSEASCPNFETGTNNGYYIGISAEYLLGDVKNSNSSIIARVVYDNQPAFFERPGDDYPSRLGNGDTVRTAVRHTTDVKYTLLQFEVMYKFNIPGTFLGITAGPQFGIPVSTNQDQRYELVFNAANPGVQFAAEDLAKIVPKEKWTKDFEPRFTNDTRTAIQLYNGEVINASSFRAAIKLGLQYEILLGRATLVPCAYYNLGITRINSDDPWRVNAIQFGADLRFAL